MKYMGSKVRIAKDILPIILKDRTPDQWYVEPFVGGANMIDKVEGNRIGSDSNHYLIAMWKKLQDGWTPPDFISRDVYDKCRKQYRGLEDNGYSEGGIGYVGFNGSYGGRFYDGGYAGKTLTKQGKERNYPKESFDNVMKQVPLVQDVHFSCYDFNALPLPDKSIIYCDPPYEGTKEYLAAKASGFSSQSFWEWCRITVLQGHKVFVSEYKAPDDFVCVWEKEVKSSLSANGMIGGNKNSTEKLFVHESQYKG